MKKIIKYVVSFFVVFLLFPMSVIAGEIIEAKCTDNLLTQSFSLLIDSTGGKQKLFAEESNVAFSKDEVFGVDDSGRGFIINFVTGQFYTNGKKYGNCRFSNLKALEKKNTVDIVADPDEGKIIQLLESIKIQQDKIDEKLDANSITEHSILAHEHGEKVSVPCSARLKAQKNYSDEWYGSMSITVALTDSLLKAHNAINETDGRYHIPMEVEITTKDGEKIPMIVGYNYEVSGGNMLNSFQTIGDLISLFSDLSEEAEKDEKMRKYGEFLNITCSFDSHSVQYH